MLNLLKLRYEASLSHFYLTDTDRLQTKAAALPEPKAPTLPKGGLAASKYADVEDEEPEAAEGEQDSSSAALASVRKPFS